MKKLILLTFGFLGWSFYEMSGGSDFEPGQVSAFQTAGVISSKTIEQGGADVAAAVVTRADSSETDLTKIATLASAPAETTPESLAKGLKRDVALAQPAVDNKRQKAMEELITAARSGLKTVPQNVRGSEPASSVSTEIVRYVPSSPDAAGLSGDVRKINANGVNMRNGPGKSHNVVAKLSNGEKVEVLRDNGDGWLKIRVAKTGRVGWAADFLVTASN